MITDRCEQPTSDGTLFVFGVQLGAQLSYPEATGGWFRDGLAPALRHQIPAPGLSDRGRFRIVS